MLGMEKGDVLGHEPMGTVVEVGSSVTKLNKGDRIVGASKSCSSLKAGGGIPLRCAEKEA